MATGMNVVNLSIGGPDYLDQPFVEKVSAPWSCTLHAWHALYLYLDRSGTCASDDFSYVGHCADDLTLLI